MRARYCTRNWGGTDHGELRDPRQRRDSGSSILRTRPEASRSTRVVLPDRPTDFLPRNSAQNLPREAFSLACEITQWDAPRPALRLPKGLSDVARRGNQEPKFEGRRDRIEGE